MLGRGLNKITFLLAWKCSTNSFLLLLYTGKISALTDLGWHCTFSLRYINVV